MFDCLNAGCLKSTKLYNTALTASSAHWQHLEACKEIFAHLTTVVDAETKVPCVSGFLLTINSVIMLFKQFTTEHSLNFLLSTRLNQDCLKNYFALQQFEMVCHPRDRNFYGQLIRHSEILLCLKIAESNRTHLNPYWINSCQIRKLFMIIVPKFKELEVEV